MYTAILIGYGLLVGLASLGPGGDGLITEPWDKLLHVVVYVIFAALARLAVKDTQRYVITCTTIVLYSGLLELAQSDIPGRVMSGYDLAANVVGVVLGALATIHMDRSRAQD